jgi:NTE family protein
MIKVGIALSSGGIKGLAHIGVLKVIEKYKIPIDLISGSSAGALVGAFYIIRGLKFLEEFVLSTNLRKLFYFLKPSFKESIIDNRNIKKFLEDNLGKTKIEELDKKLFIVATDIKTGEPYIFESGPVVDAILASIAIPLIFKPVKIKNKYLIDGAFSMPVPVEILKNKGADLKIAVNLYTDEIKIEKKLSKLDILRNSLKIIQKNAAKIESQKADILISPKFKKISFKNFNRQDFIKAGEIAAKKVLKMLLPKITAPRMNADKNTDEYLRRLTRINNNAD